MKKLKIVSIRSDRKVREEESGFDLTNGKKTNKIDVTRAKYSYSLEVT